MSCYDCPTKSCELSSIQKINLRKINRQVRQDSSLAIMKRRVAMISKQVGGGANPSSLAQAGGPGDLTSAIQKCGRNGNSYNDGKCTYRMFQKYTRVQNKGMSGVDKKHGSYARYLARRVGGELRKGFFGEDCMLKNFKFERDLIFPGVVRIYSKKIAVKINDTDNINIKDKNTITINTKNWCDAVIKIDENDPVVKLLCNNKEVLRAEHSSFYDLG